MMKAPIEPTTATLDDLQFCPVCHKLFLEEKAMYRHIVKVHRNGEYLSYNLHADLYRRWQDRLPRAAH